MNALILIGSLWRKEKNLEKTNYEKIKEMSIQKLAEWLDEYSAFEGTPWGKDFDKTYCQNCETVYNDFGTPCSYCELSEGEECRFFPNKKLINNLDIIKLWLKKKAD